MVPKWAKDIVRGSKCQPFAGSQYWQYYSTESALQLGHGMTLSQPADRCWEGLGSWFSTPLNRLDEVLSSEMSSGAYLKVFRQERAVSSLQKLGAFQLVLVSTRGSSSLEGNASRNLRDYSGRCSDVTSGFILKYWLKRRTAYLQKQMSREVWVCCALNVTVCEKQCWRVQSHPRKSKSMVEYCAWIKAHSPQKKCDAWIEQEHKSIK